jgi:hypothetical protein
MSTVTFIFEVAAGVAIGGIFAAMLIDAEYDFSGRQKARAEHKRTMAEIKAGFARRGKRQRACYTVPLSEAEKLVEEAMEEWWKEAANGDPEKRSWYYSAKPPEAQIVEARKRFGSHPDADLFFDGVTKLAEMERARGDIRMFANNKELETIVQCKKANLARLESEFAAARRKHELAKRLRELGRKLIKWLKGV